MINTLKKLKSDLIVYGLGGALINSIHFFMLPIYTRLFNPGEFGEIEMVLVVTGLLKIFYNLGLDSAQSILFYKYKLDQKRLISSNFTIPFDIWRSYTAFILHLISSVKQIDFKSISKQYFFYSSFFRLFF